jgi:hypothetical protein
MLTAVDLDDQSSLAAEEVGVIRADRRLSNELETAELAIANTVPQA